MKEITRVTQLGIGALGASYASYLHPVLGDNLTVVAGGLFAKEFEDGLVINNTEFHFKAVPPEAVAEPADLVIMAVKYDELPRAIEDIRNHVGEHTIIMSLMNGIDSEERLAERYGMDHILYSFAVGGGSVRQGNRISFPVQGTINFGERFNEPPYSEKVQAVAALFEKAGIPYAVPADMKKAMWWKFMVNTSINQLSAILGGPYALFQKPGAARDLMVDAMREIVGLAQKLDIGLGEEDITRWLDILDTQNAPEGMTSMLQDVRNNRHTEYRSFGGVTMRLAKEQGLRLPINEMLLRMMEAVEERIDLNR